MTTSIQEMDAVFNEMLNKVAAENPCGVLYLEDKRREAGHVRNLFKDQPVAFFSAFTPADADKVLREESIDVVIVDIRLGDGVETGDDWILRNADELEGKTVIILSAFLNDVREIANLRKLVSAFVRRGDFEQREVLRLPAEIARARAAERIGERVEAIQRGLQNIAGSVRDRERFGQRESVESTVSDVDVEEDVEIVSAAIGLFEKWIGRFEDQDMPLMQWGVSVLSPGDLLREVHRGSARGRMLLKAFIVDMEEML